MLLFIAFSIDNISFAQFSDVDNHWARIDISYLTKKGIAGGYSDGTFRPNRNITRAEFLKMVNRVFEYKGKIDIAFKDVNEEDWFYEDFRTAVAMGYINGYDDGTIRPNRPITREEASKIIVMASILGGELPDMDPSFKDKEKIGQWAKSFVRIMEDEGYITGYEDGTFRPKNQITRGETAKILSNVSRNIWEESIEEPREEIPKHEEFIKVIDELPNPKDIIEIIALDKVNTEKARQIFTNLTEKEKSNIPKDRIEKLINIESKIESLKTPIKSKTKATIDQAQNWARNKGAHERFIDIAPFYWYYGEITDINPEILYVQAAKETNFGRYTGAVLPEMNNWAGIKILDPIGDSTYDHEIFDTPQDGVRAHFNHMGIYCGVEPIEEPHPRWYKTSKASWAGKVVYVEDLGGRWAPSPDYGISIIRDYLRNLYNTP